MRSRRKIEREAGDVMVRSDSVSTTVKEAAWLRSPAIR